jgi:hypothetical protein
VEPIEAVHRFVGEIVFGDTPIVDDEPPAGLHHAPEFGERFRDPTEVMRRAATREEIECGVGERQGVGVGGRERDIAERALA